MESAFRWSALTALICFLAMAASLTIERHVKAYCVLFLLLETGMLGVFLALDFFLFYVFWEVMLLPMYFLIGLWGGERREYAAIKFFLYTLLGGVFILIAILMLYFNSDLKKLSEPQLLAAHVIDSAASPETRREQVAAISARVGQAHTFNILALQQIGQHTELFDEPALWGRSIGWWAFVLLFVGFAIKIPVVPLHTWLPDAHVEAPTPISMILAGVLLKMGGYGLLRICYPVCPDAAHDLTWLVALVGVASMVYGALAALGQRDFKRLVAYSSVSHMGYVVLGIAAWSAWAGTEFDASSWKMGVSGAMFQMLAHGIIASAMFFMVGVVYDRVHHRNLDHFGGLFSRMPVYSGLALGLFFAAMGLPGMCGFVGEVIVTFAAWKHSPAMGVIAAAVVVLTASYILWAIQRVYLGPEYKGPHPEKLTPLTRREFAIAAPLLAMAIFFGVFPQTVFRYMTPTINRQVDDLTAWTRNVKDRRLAADEQPRIVRAGDDANPAREGVRPDSQDAARR